MRSIYVSKILRFSPLPLILHLAANRVAHAASDAPALSLNNTDFVVLLAFVAFFAVLVYFKVPSMVASMLDKRSKSIQNEISNANVILEESKKMLADLEREHKSNIEKAKNIVIEAESEAKTILSMAKKEVRLSIERRVKLAEDQIKAAEETVIKNIKDKAIDESILKAEDELIRKSNSKGMKSIIDESLKDLELGLKKL